MKTLTFSAVLGCILAMSGVALAATVTKTCVYDHKGDTVVVPNIDDYDACKAAAVEAACENDPSGFVTVTFEIKTKKYPILPPRTETFTSVLDCQ